MTIMKTNYLTRALACGVAVSALWLASACNTTDRTTDRAAAPPPPAPANVAAPHAHDNAPTAGLHDNAPRAARVPAHYATAAAVGQLPPTLAPAQFVGKTQAAYSAVRAIPQTIAQLPCYCHCDVGFGHKSLHSCFEDDHAAHCAVCVDEALLAYRLQTEEKLTPAQIRARIIAQYGAEQ
ncbi:MAG TPA: CYCXC family (seleno)protein [Pyrinomonadaceae bacterium]|jgi:hypothetical protein